MEDIIVYFRLLISYLIPLHNSIKIKVINKLLTLNCSPPLPSIQPRNEELLTLDQLDDPILLLRNWGPILWYYPLLHGRELCRVRLAHIKA